jgi:hypothetical protein
MSETPVRMKAILGAVFIASLVALVIGPSCSRATRTTAPE